MSAKRRWVCPDCGKGKLLGERPPKDATDRFCLPCSKKTGTLVMRVCPKLERKRAKKKVVRKAKKVATKAKADAPFMCESVDLRKVVDNLWRLGRKLEPALGGVPVVKIKATRTGYLGYASYTYNELMLNRGKGSTRSLQDLTETAIHEVAHFMARQRGSKGHDDLFRAAWAELMEVCVYYGVIPKKLEVQQSARQL